jgi:ceramide glucosyltransferase
MLPSAYVAAAAGLAAIAVHLTAAVLTIRRCRLDKTPAALPHARPPVSIVRPMCGVDAYEPATLRSAFQLDYPDYEVIMCCASAGDPVIPLARQLMAAHPHISSRLIIGDEPVSENPKLNNVVKGWECAAHDWIVLADSNVLMPPDYLDTLLAAWRTDTGLVCAPPVGAMAGNFAAELECAFLNTYQATWQYAADSVGFGFAQGKTMLWRRDVLERAGGIRALGSESAEDAAATKVVRNEGLRVRLADRPSIQPLGERVLSHVWNRQLRWARLRRVSFPLFFIPEILTGCALPALCALLAAHSFDLEPALAVLAVALIWYGAEACVAINAGWQFTWRSPLAWMLRDALLPLLWVQAWLGRGFSWRGTSMQAVRGA